MKIVLPGSYPGDEIIHWLRKAIEMQYTDQLWWDVTRWQSACQFSLNPRGALLRTRLYTVVIRAQTQRVGQRSWWQRRQYHPFDGLTLRLVPIDEDKAYSEIELTFDKGFGSEAQLLDDPAICASIEKAVTWFLHKLKQDKVVAA